MQWRMKRSYRMATSNCLYCQHDFNISIKRLNRSDNKFCSARCRQRHWALNNKVRIGEYYKRFRNRTPKICKWCQTEFPRGINGMVFCSIACQRLNLLSIHKRHRTKRFDAFSEYKLSVGCLICGYKKCSAALDFHHTRPELKEFRITESVWRYKDKNPRMQAELDKCILICKNCHFEEHYFNRRRDI
jgi:hypothetical protein